MSLDHTNYIKQYNIKIIKKTKFYHLSKNELVLALKTLNGDALAQTSFALLQGTNLKLVPKQFFSILQTIISCLGSGFCEYANLRLSGGDKMEFSKYQKEEILRQAIEAKIKQIQDDFEPM